MAIYTLTDGTRKTQLTISGDTTVVFPTKLDYFGVRSLDGANILVSKIKAPTVLEDGVYSTDEGDGDVVVDDGVFTDTLYLKGSGTVVVYGGAKPNHLPFKVGGKGGVRNLGTTTTELYDGSTANPIVIDGVSVTAKRNDIAFYQQAEFMFNGTAWSAFGDLSGLGDLAYLYKSDIFDNTPTSGSSNGVTSDGVWKYTPLRRTGTNYTSAVGGYSSQALHSVYAIAFGDLVDASGNASAAFGHGTHASEAYMIAVGKYNNPRTGDLFNVGNGSNSNNRSNIIEANGTSFNVNGEIQQNGVPIRAITMPTITASMLGKVVQYVGASDSNYKQGWNYVAVSDGAAEPTYSWRALMDSAPTSGSSNPVTSDGVYDALIIKRGTGIRSGTGGVDSSASGYNGFSFGQYASASGETSAAFGFRTIANRQYMMALGRYNLGKVGSIFEIGNGNFATGQRSNILEVSTAKMNVNGDIQRDGVGIDDYTITERKIGKWIDGSDLYQRTFEVTELSKNTWNNSILGTSDIKIVDFTGLIYWLENQAVSDTTPLNYYASGSDNCFTCINTVQTDMRIYPTNTSSAMSIDKAVITIKYTKPSAHVNLMQTAPTEEVSETPTTVEEDDMR